MGIFSRLFKKTKDTSSYYDARNNGIITFNSSYGHKLSAIKAYDLYEKISVVFDAVNKIATRVSGLTLVAKDKEGEILKAEKSGLMELLEKPNTMQTKSDFLEEIATALCLKSEGYVVARGNTEREPLALEFVKPYDVQGGWNSSAAMPDTLLTNAPNDKNVYKKIEDIKGRTRYLSDDGLNELIPIIGKRYKNDWRGMSKLSPLVMEVHHIEKGNIHNRAMLENGVNPTLILAPESEVDEDDGKKLKDMLTEHYAGASKTGKPLILPERFHLISKGGTTKDMDYMQLIDVDETRIYRLFNIPLPIIKSQSMTQSNYSEAVPAFYHEAVFPLFDYIAEQLTLKIGWRFKNQEDIKITYDEFKIPALSMQHALLMKALQETDAVSVNEIRSKGGYEPDPSGDVILVPGSETNLEAVGFEKTFGVDRV